MNSFSCTLNCVYEAVFLSVSITITRARCVRVDDAPADNLTRVSFRSNLNRKRKKKDLNDNILASRKQMFRAIFFYMVYIYIRRKKKTKRDKY